MTVQFQVWSCMVLLCGTMDYEGGIAASTEAMNRYQQLTRSNHLSKESYYLFTPGLLPEPVPYGWKSDRLPHTKWVYVPLAN